MNYLGRLGAFWERLAGDFFVCSTVAVDFCACGSVPCLDSPSYTPDVDNSEAISFSNAITMRSAGVMEPWRELARVTKRVKFSFTILVARNRPDRIFATHNSPAPD